MGPFRFRDWFSKGIRALLGGREPRPPKATTRAPAVSVAQPSGREQRLHETPLVVVVGFDLGTSCSKIVIRSPYVANERAVAIPFDGLTGVHSRYLVKTLIHEGEEGRFSLEPNGETFVPARDLKVRLLNLDGAPTPTEAEIVDCGTPTTAYVALLLRRARSWFLEDQRDEFAQYRIRWEFNLGIPSAGYDDPVTRTVFDAIARSAWSLSESETPLTRQGVAKALRDALVNRTVSGVEIGVIPEIAAEVVGYARSPQRRTGLHVLVDVGASTLDISSFVLHEDEGEDRYSLLTAAVSREGVHELHKHRIAKLGAARALTPVARGALDDPMVPIPERCELYIESCGDQLSPSPREIDLEFKRRCLRTIMETLVDLWRDRYPNAPEWREGLRVFVGGGGIRMVLYRGVLTKASNRVVENKRGAYGKGHAAGLIVREVPKPENLVNEDIDQALYHRLAVASGLSFSAIDIGRIDPPGTIRNVPPLPPRSYQDDHVSKDQV